MKRKRFCAVVSQIISSRVCRWSSPLATFQFDILLAAVYFSRALTSASLAAPVSISRSQHFRTAHRAWRQTNIPCHLCFLLESPGAPALLTARPACGFGCPGPLWELLPRCRSEWRSHRVTSQPSAPLPGGLRARGSRPLHQEGSLRKGQRSSPCPLTSLTLPTKALNPSSGDLRGCSTADLALPRRASST